MPAPRPDAMPPAQSHRGLATAAAHGAVAPAAQQLASAMKDINQSTFEARRQLLKDADMSLKENREALRDIQREARELRGEAHERFMAAVDEVKASDAALKKSLKEARNTDAAGWQHSRDKVAAAYQKYLEAMARLEAARAKPTPQPRG